MTSPKTLYTKDVVNKLSFLLVTHMTCFNKQVGCYAFLKSGFNADQVLDRLDIQVLGQFLGHKMGETCWHLKTRSGGNKLSFPMPTQNMFLISTTMVMAV
jgi:hypothetical protein